jgi:hypothetical protein
MPLCTVLETGHTSLVFLTQTKTYQWEFLVKQVVILLIIDWMVQYTKWSKNKPTIHFFKRCQILLQIWINFVIQWLIFVTRGQTCSHQI